MNYFENGKISSRLWFLGLQPVGEWLLFSYTYHCCDRASPQVYSLETFQDVMEGRRVSRNKQEASWGHCVCSQEAGRTQEVEPACEDRGTPMWPTSSRRCYLLKIVQPSPYSSTSWGHSWVFTFLSLGVDIRPQHSCHFEPVFKQHTLGYIEQPTFFMVSRKQDGGARADLGVEIRFSVFPPENVPVT